MKVNGLQIVNSSIRRDVRFPDGTVPGLCREKGRIGLQKHTGTIRFRKIEVMELSSNQTTQESGAQPATDKVIQPSDSSPQILIGEWIDVLRLVDTNSAMVAAGKWSRNGEEITVSPGPSSKILAPVAVNGSYDLSVDFTWTEGNQNLRFVCPVASRSVDIVLGGRRGQASGFGKVNGMNPYDPANPTAVRPGTLQNNRRYKIVIRVRKDTESRAAIDVELDGNRYLPHWIGDPAVLDDADASHPSEIQLISNNVAVTYHSGP